MNLLICCQPFQHPWSNGEFQSHSDLQHPLPRHMYPEWRPHHWFCDPILWHCGDRNLVNSISKTFLWLTFLHLIRCQGSHANSVMVICIVCIGINKYMYNIMCNSFFVSRYIHMQNVSYLRYIFRLTYGSPTWISLRQIPYIPDQITQWPRPYQQPRCVDLGHLHPCPIKFNEAEKQFKTPWSK